MDALIAPTDPGFSVAKLRPLFSELRQKLVPLLDEVVRAFGYDFERGRRDLAPHPYMIRLGSSSTCWRDGSA